MLMFFRNVLHDFAPQLPLLNPFFRSTPSRGRFSKRQVFSVTKSVFWSLDKILKDLLLSWDNNPAPVIYYPPYDLYLLPCDFEDSEVPNSFSFGRKIHHPCPNIRRVAMDNTHLQPVWGCMISKPWLGYVPNLKLVSWILSINSITLPPTPRTLKKAHVYQRIGAFSRVCVQQRRQNC